jgi:alkanesulfonate monooxygenase SsuD/methylene tetrahydromethanopterin reductase-like flavin-dependent oxidoreductase (luciferase family)
LLDELIMTFDFRSPDWATPHARLYSEALEMAAFADRNGFTTVRISEHHGAEDGYCPYPLAVASAVASRSTRVRPCVIALLLPLYDLVRLAEELIIVDNISSGRLDVVFGAGYRPREFEMLGADFERRTAMLEERIPLLQRMIAGEAVSYGGRRVAVTPRPVQHPHPRFALAGMSRAGARRAARLDLPFVPPRRKESIPLYELYQQTRSELGLPPAPPMPDFGPGFLHVAEDPERAWSVLTPHLLHEANTSAGWLAESTDARPFRPESAESLRQNPQYAVVTPDECIDLIRNMSDPASVVIQPMPAGLDPDHAWQSLELFASQVLPRLDAEAQPGLLASKGSAR